MKEAIGHISRADPKMRRLIRMVGACTLTPDRRQSPYQSLIEAVAYQQLHAGAAESILGRFRGLFENGRFPRPEAILALDPLALRGVGFSTAKSAAIRDIAAKTIEGVIPPRRKLNGMDDEDIIKRLIVVRGVGRWTVEMFLIFTLGRLDVLPLDDYGVRKGFGIICGADELLDRNALRDYGERWRPYRSVAAWYLWRAVDLEKPRKS
jgi:DNA-3-methyladenine glycosylase II